MVIYCMWKDWPFNFLAKCVIGALDDIESALSLLQLTYLCNASTFVSRFDMIEHYYSL